MTGYEIASLVLSALIGAGQIGIVWLGISRMTRANTERFKDGVRRDKAAERQHAETMKTAERQHAETMEALAIQRRALETLIERTAGGMPA